MQFEVVLTLTSLEIFPERVGLHLVSDSSAEEPLHSLHILPLSVLTQHVELSTLSKVILGGHIVTIHYDMFYGPQTQGSIGYTLTKQEQKTTTLFSKTSTRTSSLTCHVSNKITGSILSIISEKAVQKYSLELNFEITPQLYTALNVERVFLTPRLQTVDF